MSQGLVTTYSINNINAYLDGARVQGFDESDDSFMIEPAKQSAEFMSGADGFGVISQTNDKTFLLKLKLLASSPTHEVLLRAANFARKGGKPREMRFSFRDVGSGEGGQSDCAFIIKEPNYTAGNKQGNREWEIVLFGYEQVEVTDA